MNTTVAAWPRVSLASISDDVTYGHTASAKDAAVGPKFLRITDIQNGHVDWNAVPYCESSSEEADRYRLHSDDILFARTGATTGKSFLISECPETAVFASYLIRVRPSDSVEARYLAHFFDTPDYWAQVRRHSRGAGQPGVNATSLKSVEIPLPPLSEQRRIADILDKADAIRRKRREAVNCTSKLAQAIFIDVYGDPVSNSKEWPLQPLTKYGEITTGNTPSRRIPTNYGKHLEWIKSDNINTPHHYLTSASEHLSVTGAKLGRSVDAGATLITCIAGSRDCVGNAALTDRTVAFNQQINAIQPSAGIDPHFLYGLIWLSKRRLQRASTDSMKGMISKSKLEGVEVIAVPPEKQATYGRLFLKCLAQEQEAAKAWCESDRLFSSLCQRAFRGELQ